MQFRFSIWHTLATLGLAGTLVFTIAVGGGALAFVHLPIFLFVVGVCFLLMLGAYGNEFWRFLLHAVCSLFAQPQAANPRYTQIAQFGCRSAAGAGSLAMLIGLVQMLTNLSSPEDIGRGMAVAMLAPLYALVISEVFFAYVNQSFMEKEAKPEKSVVPLKSLGIPMLIVFFTVSVFLVLLLSFAKVPIS